VVDLATHVVSLRIRLRMGPDRRIALVATVDIVCTRHLRR